ncbi:MAG: hypothetical protein AAF244_02320 [Pseudomonadota bacterium]
MDFEVRPRSAMKQMLGRGAFEVVVRDTSMMSQMGRLSNSWFANALSTRVIPDHKILNGNIGDLPFSSSAERDKFLKDAGRELMSRGVSPQ